jgi:hypothetical protein
MAAYALVRIPLQPQHRAQAHDTSKVLFNSLYLR